MSNVLDISSATAQVGQDLLKALAILSDKTARISAVDWKDIKPYWKSVKRPQGDQQPYHLQAFERLHQPQKEEQGSSF